MILKADVDYYCTTLTAPQEEFVIFSGQAVNWRAAFTNALLARIKNVFAERRFRRDFLSQQPTSSFFAL